MMLMGWQWMKQISYFFAQLNSAGDLLLIKFVSRRAALYYEHDVGGIKGAAVGQRGNAKMPERPTKSVRLSLRTRTYAEKEFAPPI